MKVLVVDDEYSVRLLVSTIVAEAGHECCCAENGRAALSLFSEVNPDVVVLDVMMPKMDGFEVCERIRAIDERVPVLFLSAKSDITDKRIGFANGGDDYLVKPFNEEELIMRVEALWRRAARGGDRLQGEPERFVLGEFEFDAVRHRVLQRSEAIPLTPKEFQLLFHLAWRHGEVMSKEELVESCWGREYLDESVGIAAYVRKIRAKIEANPAKPEHLKTVWGVGYVFEA